jgi:hypothetical protein
MPDQARQPEDLRIPLCRRKIEMTPGAQSRDDTPLATNARARDLNCILQWRI